MVKASPIRRQVLLYSLLITMIAVCVTGSGTAYFISRNYRNFIIQEKYHDLERMVELFTAELANRGLDDYAWLEEFGQIYSDQGFFLTLSNKSGDRIWSCTEEENCPMASYDSGEVCDTSLMTTSYPIPFGVDDTYSLSICHRPPDDLSREERKFIQGIFTTMGFSISAALLFAIAASLIFSKSLTGSLSTLSAYAVRLSFGEYGMNDSPVGRSREAKELHYSIGQLARSLERQRNLRQELTQSISHELRTPLAKLQSQLEAMIDGVVETDESRLNLCLGEVLRLSGLVGRLDDLSRFDLEGEKISPKPINLEESLSYAIHLYEQDLVFRNLEVTISGTGGLLRADEEKLKQVWINLFSNSIKNMKDGGKIEVKMANGPEEIEIFFHDNGEGIDPLDLPYVFERFYKGVRSQRKEGSGLGLAIVKEIMVLHGGEVRAESDPEMGTTIVLKFPNY